MIRALFDMTKRYLLFCPNALFENPEFATIFSLGVACLTECQGERESTRASLNFLTQLISWKSMKINSTTYDSLQGTIVLLDTSLAQHGESVVQFCICGVAGASPQMLWPALSECLFSVLQYFALEQDELPASFNENNVCYRWVFLALADNWITSKKNIDDETKKTFVQILFRLIREGLKSKPMVKMLLSDFGAMCKGEKTSECLLSYSLQ